MAQNNVVPAERAGVYLVVDEQGRVVAVRKVLAEARALAGDYGQAA